MTKSLAAQRPKSRTDTEPWGWGGEAVIEVVCEVNFIAGIVVALIWGLVYVGVVKQRSDLAGPIPLDLNISR
jgi:hypothetical protein